MLQNNPELKSKIDQLWNKFWSGGISNPLTAIEQITYLLFMKRLDELDQKKLADADFTGEPYTSKFEGQWIPPEYRAKAREDDTQKETDKRQADARMYEIDKRTLRWSEFKRMQAEEMLQHVQSKVFPFLKDMNGSQSNFTRHMRNAVFIIPKPALLVEAVKTIDEIFEIMEKDSQEKGQAFQDIQGDVYEMLLSEIATAGKNGQFRTPRHIIKLMADLVRPQLGHRITDPACGSGGFLLGAYQYIVTQLAIKAGTNDLKPDEDGFVRTSVAAAFDEKRQAILQASLYGYDIDSTMVRLGLMNLMMHGIDEPNVDYKDTLSKSYNEEAEYDIVMANPPFTGSIDKGDINGNLTLSTTKTELLFVENIYRLLKKGGTACVIVPQGVLFGSGGALARQLLPDYILGYSSGENEILSLPFFKMRFVQFDEYWQALKQPLPYPGRPESRLVYLDRGFSQAILLCNLLFQDADALTPFRDDVKIEELREFRIIIRRSIDPAHNAAGRRKAFYPYAVGAHEIEITVDLNSPDIDRLTPADIQLTFGPAASHEEIETWKEVYVIDERYKAKCCDSDAKDWLEQVRILRDTYGIAPDAWLVTVQQQTAKAPVANSNFLKSAFLEACQRAGLFEAIAMEGAAP